MDLSALVSVQISDDNKQINYKETSRGGLVYYINPGAPEPRASAAQKASEKGNSLWKLRKLFEIDSKFVYGFIGKFEPILFWIPRMPSHVKHLCR